LPNLGFVLTKRLGLFLFENYEVSDSFQW